MKEISGKVLKLGDSIGTAQILPEKYLGEGSASEMAKYVLEGYGESFPAKMQGSGVLVAGSHFGCGPTPAQAAVALKAAGISCLIAKSFGRAFFRGAINEGLPAIAVDIVGEVSDGDKITISLEQGEITYPGGETSFAPYPEFVLNIVRSGDLIAAIKKELGKK